MPSDFGYNFAGKPNSKAYFKQVKLHPSASQIWATQVVGGCARYIAFSSTLATYVYDISDYSLCQLLTGSSANIAAMKWHPSEPRLVILNVDGTATAWDALSGERLQSVHLSHGKPLQIAWASPNEYKVAIATTGGLQLWDLDRPGNPGRGVSSIDLLSRKRSSTALGSLSLSPGKRSKGLSKKETELLCVEWHPSLVGVMCLGYSDGTVIIHDTELDTCAFIEGDDSAVVAVDWDSLSGVYLLLGYRNGAVRLWDTERKTSVENKQSQMQSFDKRVKVNGLLGVKWLHWAPGNFLTWSSKSGVAKVWNASQDQPLDLHRMSPTGSAFVYSSMMQGKERRVVSCFIDGSVSLYSMSRRQIEWRNTPGHTETIFDCSFAPTDKDTLATSSYDATVKLWHTPTMDLKLTLMGHKSVVYSTAWSPDGEKIASASCDGIVIIHDSLTGKILKRLELHAKAVYCVRWNIVQSDLLICSSGDCSVSVFDVQGMLHRVYNLPTRCYGCDWSPFAADIFAVGSEDGLVRVFSFSRRAQAIEKSSPKPILILQGHKFRVFHIRFNPLVNGLLASGSDDQTVRVWDLSSYLQGTTTTAPISSSALSPSSSSQPSSPSSTSAPAPQDASILHRTFLKTVVVMQHIVLHGHTANVRPLCWSTEIPWLLLSGGWDGTIRAWDIRMGVSESGEGSGSTGTGNAEGSGVGASSNKVSVSGSAEGAVQRRSSTAGSGGSGSNGSGRNQAKGGGSARACIAVMLEHLADVYGIAAHPSRPFLWCSCSRDTTLRFFQIEGFTAGLKIRAVRERGLKSCLGRITEAMQLLPEHDDHHDHHHHNDSHRHNHRVTGADGEEGARGSLAESVSYGGELDISKVRLCGRASQSLAKELSELRSDGRLMDLFQLLFDFFWGADGMDEFWLCLHAVSREFLAGLGRRRSSTHCAAALAPASPPQRPKDVLQLPAGLDVKEVRVVHHSCLLETARAMCVKLERPGAFHVGDRELKRVERTEDAADLHLYTGDLRGYCEAMVKRPLYRWEHALALAPGVSLEYWRELSQRYCDFMQEEDMSSTQVAVLPFLLAAGRLKHAVDWLLTRKDLMPATTLAKAVEEEAYLRSTSRSHPRGYNSPHGHEHEYTHNRAKSGGSGSVTCGHVTVKTDVLVLSEAKDQGNEGSIDESPVNPRSITNSSSSGDNHQDLHDYGRNLINHEHDAAVSASTRSGENGGRRRSSSAVSGVNVGAGEQRGAGGGAVVSVPILSSSDCDLTELEATATLFAIMRFTAESYETASEYVLAATAHLAVGDVKAAIADLMEGNEAELAYAASTALGISAAETDDVLRDMVSLLSTLTSCPNHHLFTNRRRAESAGDIELAIEVAKELRGTELTNNGSDECDLGEGSVLSTLIAARNFHRRRKSVTYASTLRDRDSYMEDVKRARRMQSDTRRGDSIDGNGDTINVLRWLLMAGEDEECMSVGVAVLRNLLAKDDLIGMARVVQALGGIRAELLPQNMRLELLAYCNYAGALQACAAGWWPIVDMLFASAASLVAACKSSTADFPRCMRPGLVGMKRAKVMMKDFKDKAAATEVLRRLQQDNSLSPHEMEEVEDLLVMSESKEQEHDDDDDDGVTMQAHPSLVRSSSSSAPSSMSMTTTAVTSIAGAESNHHVSRGVFTSEPGSTGLRSNSRLNMDSGRASFTTSPAGGSGALDHAERCRIAVDRQTAAVRRGDPIRPYQRTMTSPITTAQTFRRAGGALCHHPLSVVTGKPVVGPAIMLEDGTTHMSLSEAIMWYRVNPFSPLNTGRVLTPL